MSNPTVAGFRLSTQQERTWSQNVTGVGPYWAECELDIAGPLDTAKLQRVIHEVVARHEILRTAFHRQTGVKIPFQVVLESTDFAWNAADLTGQDDALQTEKLAALVAERDAAIDLEKGPVLHVALARVSSNQHRLALSLPALCADMRTMQNLVSEILRGYAEESTDAEEVMQYADIAQWQQDLLASEESKAARDYWREYCKNLDFDALTTVLSSFEKRSAGAFSPACVGTQVDLKTLDANAENNLPEFLLSAWLVFLARTTGRRRLTVGCQFEGRNYAELTGSLGAFAKNLPLTCECADGLTFYDLLAQVQASVAEFRNWQDGFVWSHADHSGGDVPGAVLPVAFEFGLLTPAVSVGDLTVTARHQRVCSEQFEIRLTVARLDDRLGLAFQFDASQLDCETVERWSHHFVTLLMAAAANPETPIDRLPMLEASERQQLLVAWNQTVAAYRRQNCIHELFEEQAARTPDAEAVRYEDDCLTYQQLNERANQLAHHLRTKGVGKGSLVALCLQRSTNTMAAVLAILKAGGGYVPLSADHPKPRLARQLSVALALITEGKFECIMPAFDGAMILIDRDQEQWSRGPITNAQPVAKPDDLAYVIFTSGSTGTPKGVAVRHRNLVNYTSFIQRRLELENYSRPLHFATVSTLGADLGNTCIYPALASGGCLHIIDSEVAADSQRLQEYMAKYPVDVLKIVPSHLMALLQAGGGSAVLPREHLILGGEALTAALLEKIVAADGTCQVLNHYGPTETTVGSLTFRVRDLDYK
ncbi:MAG TPA: AMP-binding protein, partial [Candidatus Angelobacter sp.]|nr:AMP-binding protein [Candidatus Angelobacter sp.]